MPVSCLTVILVKDERCATFIPGGEASVLHRAQEYLAHNAFCSVVAVNYACDPITTSGNTMNQTLKETLQELALGCRILHMEGHADLTLGHLAYRDPEARGAWIKRSGISLGEVRDHNDFVLIDWQGTQLDGQGLRHKEWPIHTEIFRARPDIQVCGHSHPHYATLFSALDVPLVPVTNEAAYLRGKPGRFDITTGLIDTPKLGTQLSQALDSAATVLMQNHGITYVGRSIEECVLMGIFLERACRSQLTLISTGLAYHATPDEALVGKFEQILDAKLMANFWAFHKRKLAGITI
jgi:L-fuculose-phosphate aldolase